MTVTLEIPSENEAELKARAEALNLTVEEWLTALASQHLRSGSVANLQVSDPEQWLRLLGDWIDSHDPNLPVLSEAAMSRESIYPDRV